MRFEWRWFRRTFNLSLYSYGEQGQYVAGITNRCKDGGYCLFIDYDDVPADWVTDELEWLQEFYQLGDVHLFKTGHGYHAICTQKFRLSELIRILRSTSTDAAYVSVPMRRARKMWTLRISRKAGAVPTYLRTLKGFRGCEESKPHNDVLRKLYNLNLPVEREDAEKKFWTGHYHIEA